MERQKQNFLKQSTNRLNITPWFFWGLAFPLIVLNIWVFVFVFNAFQGIISSFILAGFLSLLLNHPIQFLQRRFNLNRGYSILLIFISFAVAFGFLSIIFIPFIAIRFSEFINILPDWIESATLRIDSLGDWANSNSRIVDSDKIMTNLAENFQNQLQAFIVEIPSFIFGTIGDFLNIFFIIENTLPPRLLGKLTGLNPIVILFSVMVGATLGDFIGLITAVPIAATIKSLVATFGQSKSPESEQLLS